MPKQEHNPLQDHMQWNEYVQREIKDQSKENVRGKQYQTFLPKDEIPTQGNKLISGSFNNKLPEPNNKTSGYDRLFHVNDNYDNKIHRDDRASRRGLDVNTQELSKKVPQLSSSEYGRLMEIEKTSRDHVRVESVYKGFYRSRGTGIPFGGTQNSYVEEDGH